MAFPSLSSKALIVISLLSLSLYAHNDADYALFESYASGQIAEQLSFDGRDLSGLIINGTAFKDKNLLKGAVFNRANLEETIFINVRLDEAKFIKANLKGAQFINTSCRGALFHYANLTGIKAFTLRKQSWDPERKSVLRSGNAEGLSCYKDISRKLKNRPLSTIAGMVFGPINSLCWETPGWVSLPAAIICLPYFALISLEESAMALGTGIKNILTMNTDFSYADFFYARLEKASFCEPSNIFLDSKLESELIDKSNYASYREVFNEHPAKIDNAKFHHAYTFQAKFPEEPRGEIVKSNNFSGYYDKSYLRAILNSNKRNKQKNKLMSLSNVFIEEDVDFMRAMLRFGSNPNQLIKETSLMSGDSQDPVVQLPALLYAIKHNQKEVALELLKKPDMNLPIWCRRKTIANPLLCDNKGNNALHWAVKKWMLHIINLLVIHPKAQQLINQDNADGLSPLSIAIAGGNVSFLKVLMKALPSKKQPVYSVALKHHKSHLIPFLASLDYGFDVNVQDSDSLSPLHYAVRQSALASNGSMKKIFSSRLGAFSSGVATTSDCFFKTVKGLIALGARRDIRNNQGQSSLYYARLKKHPHLEKILNAPQVSDHALLNVGTEDLPMLLNDLTPQSPRSLHSFTYTAEAETMAVKQSLQEKVAQFNEEYNRNVQFLDYATLEVDDDAEEVEDIYGCLLGEASPSQTPQDLTPADLFVRRYKTASKNAPSLLFIHKLHELAKGDGMLGTLKRELESRDYKGVMVISTMPQSEAMESALQNRLAVDMRPASFILTKYQREQLLHYFFGLHVPQLQLNNAEFDQLVEKTSGMDRNDLENFVRNAEIRARNENGLPGCVTCNHFLIQAPQN